MSEAATHLRRLVELFRNIGINNDVRIAEHVAALLLMHNEWEQLTASPEGYEERLETQYDQLREQFSTAPSALKLRFEIFYNILEEVKEAIEASQYTANLGTFFQREIRYELLKATSGTQYPTPHHVAALMAEIAVAPDSQRVLDPTAGTAGLLVAAHHQNNEVQLNGTDFDPQWVNLASANLILNSADSSGMDVKQALDLYNDTDYIERFDSVLMNPPFGGSRSANEIEATVGSDFGRTSSTALAALALYMLTENGIAAFLQPSGTLFGSGGEKHLRDVLMESYALEAVITLPPDAMQPYSQVATHLLVARRAAPSDAIWFVSLTSDGYPPGMSRDLTADPISEQNEFPRSRDLVVKSRADEWQTRLTVDEIGEIQTLTLGDDLPGLSVRLTGDTENARWHVTYLNDGLLLKVYGAEGELNGGFYETYDDDDTWLVFNPGETVDIDWVERFDREDFAEGLETAWNTGLEEVTVSLSTDDQTLTLQKSRTSFVFGGQEEQDDLTTRACLFNADGQPVTPWLSITEAKRQKDIKSDDFGSDVGAVRIEDINGSRIGWLLELSSATDAKDQDQLATLVIIFQSECTLFNTQETANYALLENGWVSVGENGRIKVVTGKQVRLREDVHVQGLAVGPAPLDPTSHSLFGVLVPQSELTEESNLLPGRFLPEPEAVPLGHPLDVLANIRRSQTELAGKVDSLLGILGQPGSYDETSETAAELPAWLGAMLNTEQSKLLNLLKSKQVDGKPLHFNEAELATWCVDDGVYGSSDDVDQQIRLFERLGVIKAVHSGEQNLYRMITNGDMSPMEESS